VLIALLLPAVQAAREAARRMQCSNNVKQMILAVHNYVSTTGGRFPPGCYVGSPRPKCGLHVILLPYLEGHTLHDQIDFDLSTYEGVNRDLGEVFVDVYVCPSDGQQPIDPYCESGFEWQTTNYEAVMGPGRNGEVVPAGGYGDYSTDGVFFPHSKTRVADVTDGTAQTLAIGERTYELRSWMKGGQDYTGTSEVSVFSAKNIRWPINSNPGVVCYRNCPSGRTCLYNDLFFGSRHPGGAHFALADGSVQFIDEAINFTVYEDLATIAGEEVAAWLPE
jgi:prepilin-type processing-associated H-X9-DG protein